jgi:hypothetical protein
MSGKSGSWNLAAFLSYTPSSTSIAYCAPNATRKFGSLLQKERLVGAPLCSALFSGADSFLGASVGRFYSPTAKGWRCLGPFDRDPMRPNVFRVVHDRAQ